MPPVDATQSVALLGPTNTGKTHRAVERMLEHETGMIGLPLRLLAREVYDRLTVRLGEERVALVTGEEKRTPRRPDYWVCTTEAMPLTREVDFVAVDEVQLATHEERGHVFTDRLLHARGRKETWFLGAATMHDVVAELVPAAQRREYPRLSKLSYTGVSKLSRLPKRTAVVAFSVKDLYALAARMRVLHGGTAIVMGSLSPRARNAQVALFQAGEVDYLVATDAIGMGLNLDIDHVAFAALRKFDGQKARSLDDAEIGQIAGRAGRFTRDGSFGTLAPCDLERTRAERIEAQLFERVRRVRYRNSELDFTSPAALSASLRLPPRQPRLALISDADDVRAFEALVARPAIANRLRSPADVELLFRVCQIPDFRKILFEVHVDLLAEIFGFLCEGPIGDDFMNQRVGELNRTDGDADALMARIARLRTWSFVANHSEWVERAQHFRSELAALEHRLSDALHAQLVLAFVERSGAARGSKARARQKTKPLPERVNEGPGYRPFAVLDGWQARVQSSERESAEVAPDPRVIAVDAPHEAFRVAANGTVFFSDLALARLQRGAAPALPEVRLLEAAATGAGQRAQLQRRLFAFARDIGNRLLADVRTLARSSEAGLRAIAYQLEQGLGTALTSELKPVLQVLSDADRRQLAELDIHVGRVAVYVPALLKPAALEARAILVRAHDAVPVPERLGRPSYPLGPVRANSWLALGYVALGPRALRCDLLERAALWEPEREQVFGALGSLGVPRVERPRVAGALRAVAA